MRALPLLVLLACTHPAPPQAPKPEGLKPWAEAIADTTRHESFIPIRVRRDNAVLLELAPDHLERDFGMVLTLAKGSGTNGLVDGAVVADSQLVRLHRAGDKVYLISRSAIPRAKIGSPIAVAVARDPGESVIGAFPVIADDKTRILADASDLFVTDHADLHRWFFTDALDKPETKRAIDKARSFVDRVRAFPNNIEIDATVTLAAELPKATMIPAAADPRAISVTVRWSWFALPERPMQPRLADDRVGYFAHPIRDYGEGRPQDLEGDGEYIHRWRLEKRDPAAAHSPAVQPIRFVIDPSVPHAYRPYVREGVLAWNRAFAAVGIDDAIAVEDAPTTDYDPDDLRFNVIRWTTAGELPFYAYGPSDVDPRTGELLHGHVVMIADMFTDIDRSFRVWTQPARGCGASMGGDLSLVRLAGMTGAVDFDGNVGPYVRELMMHEIGHTLGLRHNFRGSAAIPFDKLNDKAYTAEHGITASVMDYIWTNIAADPAHQGDLFQNRIGDYDMFAIAYGYTPVPGEDRAALAKLATSTNPAHAYSTDEDVNGGPWAVDPAAARFDGSDDPVRYALDRLALLDRVTPKIGAALVHGNSGWAPVRDFIGLVLGQRARQLHNVLLAVGGTTFRRGVDGGLTPIPDKRQRDALQFVLDRGFSDTAFALPPDLAAAPPRRAGTIVSRDAFPVDVPVHQLALSHQRGLLESLLSPVRLHRILDNQARSRTPSLTIAELFATTTAALFGELSVARPTVTPRRRNVQRLYVDELIAILLAKDKAVAVVDILPGDTGEVPGASVPAPPADARATARHELAVLAARAKAVAAKAADLDTRVHLEDLAARASSALDARVIDARPAE